MMNGSDKKPCGRQNGTPNIPKRPVPVADLLAAEQALTHEERVRKAMNLKPYLDYLSDLFAQELSDSSGSEDEEHLPSAPARNQLPAHYNAEEASKCPAITQAIHTLNLSLGETPSLSASTYLDHTGKTEPEEFSTASQFSPSNSYSSSLGLSPESTDNEKHGGQEASELPPISDLELHKYLDKPAHEQNSPANEYMISYLNSSNADFKTNRKRKWDQENPNSLLTDLKPKSPSPGSSGIPTLSNPKTINHLSQDDPLLSGIGIDGTDAKESSLKIKEDPDKLIMTKGYEDFRDYMKSSISQDKLNLNQTAREDNDEECVDGENQKRNEDMEDEDDDSLSDYMNITANSALALDTFFKFDPDDLTSSAQSPLSPSTAHILPSLSNQSALKAELDDSTIEERGLSIASDMLDRKTKKVSAQKHAKTVQMLNLKRRRVYTLMCKKEVCKVARTRTNLHQEVLSHMKQLAEMCSSHLYEEALESQKMMKESTWRATRLTGEVQGMWKQRERTEKEMKRRKIREAEDQKRLDVELNEAREQQKKFNILTLQMGVYAAAVSEKLNGIGAAKIDENLLERIEEIKNSSSLYLGDDEWELTKQHISRRVKKAFELHSKHMEEYLIDDSNPSGEGTSDELSRSGLFAGTLKSFQEKGMEWLINSFDHGVNGVLADEAGLGKRVQLLALLGYLAQNRNNWGPFLIIASASTQQNWQQEFQTFLPSFTARIYTGNSQERKVLRGNWLSNTALLGKEKSIFHVLITSHQIVSADLKHLNRLKWQYLVLDEAQTATGMKWKALLGLNCHSRLFLTGRPIQNAINVLWKFLHFLMPYLFDADAEFGECASKNIELHSEMKFAVDEKDLGHLRAALKTFILKRTKKDVVNELPEKIEFLIPCPLTARQRLLNFGIKKKIRIEDLQKPFLSSQLTQIEMTNVMNLVMQLRKVCSHPDLIEKRELKTPFHMNKILAFYPKTLVVDKLVCEIPTEKRHLFDNYFNIFSPLHTHRSLCGSERDMGSTEDISKDQSNRISSEWSFSRFSGMDLQEISELATGGFMQRWSYILKIQKMFESLYRRRLWKTNDEDVYSKYLSAQDFLLYPDSLTSFPSIENSPILNDLVFASPTSPVYAFLDERISEMVKQEFNSSSSSGMEELQLPSDRKGSNSTVATVRSLLPNFLPRCLNEMSPKVFSGGRSFTWRTIEHGGIWIGEPENDREYLPPTFRSALESLKPQNGWSGILLPDKNSVLADSGKLRVLDQLLCSMKRSKSQVIIYTQMNRMIGILEEFLAYRKWDYALLDGSIKRRHNFNGHDSAPKFLVLLGWTRAPNPGINLSFADSVIFYDCDWNPAVDREALDRTYHVGRSKKLTVFRLVSEGTIEISILKKTIEKAGEEGFNSEFDTDALKPAELLSLLLKDEELKLLAFEREENPPVDLDQKSFALKPKSCTGIPYKFFKERFVRKFKAQEREPSSSVGSSVSVAGSSPANSDMCGGEEGDTELQDEDMEFESCEDEDEPKPHFPPQDIDCVDGALPSSSRSTPNLLDWNAGSISDYDEDLGLIVLNRPKLGRGGGGRRGRPPTRVRVMSRDEDGSRRGRPVGRPRKRIGPPNQGVRGRKPGRPPLTKKAEILMPSTLTLTQSETVFGDSSPAVDSA